MKKAHTMASKALSLKAHNIIEEIISLREDSSSLASDLEESIDNKLGLEEEIKELQTTTDSSVLVLRSDIKDTIAEINTCNKHLLSITKKIRKYAEALIIDMAKQDDIKVKSKKKKKNKKITKKMKEEIQALNEWVPTSRDS